MSGHTPLTLNLTPINNINQAKVRELFRVLEKEFRLEYNLNGVRKLMLNPSTGDWYPKEIKQKYDSLDELTGEQKYFWVSGEILFDNLAIWIEIKFLPVVAGQETVFVSIDLESKAYDAIYDFDLTQNSFNEKAKEILIRFCADVSNALGAEGFVLSFTSRSLPPPEVEIIKVIVSDLINAPRNLIGLINGVHKSLLDESMIKKSENSKIDYQVNEYLILETIRPFDI